MLLIFVEYFFYFKDVYLNYFARKFIVLYSFFRFKTRIKFICKLKKFNKFHRESFIVSQIDIQYIYEKKTHWKKKLIKKKYFHFQFGKTICINFVL